MSDPVLDTPADPAPVDPVDPAPADPAPADPTPADLAPVDPAAKIDWPEDWRDRVAGGDDKKLKRLQRYGSPNAAMEALFSAQAKISAGIKEPLKEGATAEELATWRADNGIPESPDKYDLTLPDGLVLGERDKPLVDGFLKVAHEKNWSPEAVKTAVGWFMERQAEQADTVAARDTENRMAAEDQMRDEFGPKYRDEVKLAAQFVRNSLGENADTFMGGRLADGRLIGDSPEVVRWLNQTFRELNPVATVVPGSGTNAVQAVESELANLRSMMGDRKSDYWKKGAVGEKHQSRYRELTTALQRQKAA